MLKAPDDDCCSFSNNSCSSLGSLGGDGPGDQDERTAGMEANVRRKKPGRMVRIACEDEIMIVEVLSCGCVLVWLIDRICGLEAGLAVRLSVNNCTL